MADASTSGNLSPALMKVAERAKQEPEGKFNSLAHLIDEAALRRAYGRIDKNAAVGVDGTTKEQYGQDLDGKLRDLHARLKAMRYRHQPIRRVHIPKDRGGTRPIGISTVEDKIVQGALTQVLEAVYEPIFLDCSYGFRRGRRAHDALKEINRAAYRHETNWVIEADIVSFFDSIDRTQLHTMLAERVPDGSIHRLVGKCLNVGILDGASTTSPDEGTVQGSVLSPLLGNIYLHHVLDVWFDREVKPRLAGKATLVRYADDFVIGFERKEDAERVWAVLPQRMQRFNLQLHPEKTRLFDFRRPRTEQKGGKGPATFDFLGFTIYWKRGRTGTWNPTLKTRRVRLTRAINALNDWCRRHRHWSLKTQHAAIARRVQGHFNYFGVSGNGRSLGHLFNGVKKVWLKWLRRRSNRTRLTWKRFIDILLRYPLPRPRITVQMWAARET